MVDKERVGVYAGSFDPITNGHVDIIRRGCKVFDKLIVAIGINADKKYMLTLDERIDLIKMAIKGTEMEGKVTVDCFTGLLVNFVNKRKAKFIVRGLRAVSDFDKEFQMAIMNSKMHEEIESVFMMTDNKYFFLSSSMIKEVAMLGGDVEGLVPDKVHEFLMEKIKKMKDDGTIVDHCAHHKARADSE